MFLYAYVNVPATAVIANPNTPKPFEPTLKTVLSFPVLLPDKPIKLVNLDKPLLFLAVVLTIDVPAAECAAAFIPASTLFLAITLFNPA